MESSNIKWMEPKRILMNRENKVSKKKMSLDATSSGLNDIGFRLVLIPFFGIAIPILTDMIADTALSHWVFKLSFLYSIGIAWIVWEGNRFLLFTLRNYFDWYEKPIRKIGALLLVVPFYTIPISVLLLYGWYSLFANVAAEWQKIRLATAVILICVLFIVHVYETVFLVKEAESEKVLNAWLEKSKTEAELHALKSQIDPHFIFNSLNTLSHLIEIDPPVAQHFNQKLSDVYRYILQNRESDFVFLEEELNFVEDYFSMLKIRYGEAVHLEIGIEKNLRRDYLILPISLQLLIENAVKHNEFSDDRPLRIFLDIQSNYVEVRNQWRRRIAKASPGLGLKNLQERCLLLMIKPVEIIAENDTFRVRVPLLKS